MRLYQVSERANACFVQWGDQGHGRDKVKFVDNNSRLANSKTWKKDLSIILLRGNICSRHEPSPALLPSPAGFRTESCWVCFKSWWTKNLGFRNISALCTSSFSWISSIWSKILLVLFTILLIFGQRFLDKEINICLQESPPAVLLGPAGLGAKRWIASPCFRLPWGEGQPILVTKMMMI